MAPVVAEVDGKRLACGYASGIGERAFTSMVLGPDEGEVISSRAERWVAIKADLPLLSVTESRFGPGERGPLPHVHCDHADCF